MKRFLCVSALLVLAASLAVLETRAVGQTPAASAPAVGGPDQHREMLNTYCVDCHNTTLKTGGLALDALDLNAAGRMSSDEAKTWEKALRKLRGRLMPPPGNPQPPQKDIDSFTAWMENALDTHAKGPKAGPTAGYVPIQRLNRTEYAASVKALVGVDVNVKDVLPQDIQVDGFDNIAAALSVSPSFLDQYITAARSVAKLAVGNPNPRVSNVKYTIAANQDPQPPLPLGTRGGIRFKHNFPADGEYRINIVDLGAAQALYTGPLENETTLVIMIDGKVVFKKTVGGPADLDLAERKAGAGRDEITEPLPRTFPCRSMPASATSWSRSSTVPMWSPTRMSPAAASAEAGARMVRMAEGVEVDRAVQPHGYFENSQPRPDLCLRSQSRGGTRLREADHGKPGAPGVPPAGDRGRCGPPHAVL